MGVTTWPNGTVVTRYAFQHALYQQVVYERLGAGWRVRLHQRLGEGLAAAYGAQAGEVAAELAEHFERSYDVRRAVHYLQQAAEKAAQRYAPCEVVVLLTRALALLRQLPETPVHLQQELALQIALGAALLATKGYAAPEVAQTYTRARQLCQHLEDPQQLFPVLRGLWNYYQGRAELQTAHALSAQLLTLAQQTRDPAMLSAAHRALGSTLLFLGAPAAAHAHLAHALALYDAQQHRAAAFLYGDEAGVVCRSRIAWTLWYLGYPDQGLARSEETVTLAEQMASPFSLDFALSGAALFHQLRREGHVAQEYAETAICLAMEQGFPYWRVIGSLLSGWVLALQGQAREGLEQLHQGLTAMQATGTEVLRPYFLALLAEGYGTTGQPAAGLTGLAEALTLVEKTAARWYAPEIYRLKGELLLQQSPDHHAAAQACFHRALDLARHQQARSLELRAAMSLAQLWQQQDKCAQAYQLLAEVYGWFTEGFDTADLRQARTFLDTLA
jgi:predicted ATPase